MKLTTLSATEQWLFTIIDGVDVSKNTTRQESWNQVANYFSLLTEESQARVCECLRVENNYDAFCDKIIELAS